MEILLALTNLYLQMGERVPGVMFDQVYGWVIGGGTYSRTNVTATFDEALTHSLRGPEQDLYNSRHALKYLLIVTN